MLNGPDCASLSARTRQQFPTSCYTYTEHTRVHYIHIRVFLVRVFSFVFMDDDKNASDNVMRNGLKQSGLVKRRSSSSSSPGAAVGLMDFSVSPRSKLMIGSRWYSGNLFLPSTPSCTKNRMPILKITRYLISKRHLYSPENLLNKETISFKGKTIGFFSLLRFFPRVG